MLLYQQACPQMYSFLGKRSHLSQGFDIKHLKTLHAYVSHQRTVGTLCGHNYSSSRACCPAIKLHEVMGSRWRQFSMILPSDKQIALFSPPSPAYIS